MARSISSSGTDQKMTASEADPYTVMINAIRVRVEHNPVMLGGYRTALESRELEGYRNACFDIASHGWSCHIVDTAGEFIMLGWEPS